ncbi:MAG: hypothetical protein PHW77_04255 [Eubacteriales bacterium]|nr:hypothetical protein [Eubacteriales bacterium]
MKSTIKLVLCVILTLSVLLTSCGTGRISDESSLSVSDTSASEDSSAISETGDDSSYADDSSDSSAETSEEEPEFLRNEIYFDDIVYETPDFDEIYRKIASVQSLFDEEADSEEIKNEFEILVELMWDVSTACGLLSIIQSLDTTDTEISDELVILSENFTNAQKYYYKLAVTLLDSYCSDIVFAECTDTEKEEIRENALLIDDEYVSLTAELTELQNKYIDHLSLTIYAEGKEMTLQEVMDTYGYYNYIRALNYVGGEIYLDLVKKYKTIAVKAGYETYADYAYNNEYYRDYTVNDSKKLHAYVKEYIAPLYAQLSNKVSYFNSAGESNPFDYEDIILAYSSTMSEDMVNAYKYMKKYGLYSIDDNAVKQVGAYTTYLYSYDIPFIFQHTSGNYSDIQTFIHEFGHFYAYYLHGPDLPFMIDIDEIHSQANELLFLPYYAEIYGESACEKITLFELYSNLDSIISGCLFDEFEQAVFAGEYDSVEELNALYVSICEEYGITNVSEYGWVRIQHLFLYPFYYISYAVSLIPSLEIYSASIDERDIGIAMYNELLEESLNCTGFMDLMNNSGFANPFDEATIIDIAETVKNLIN